MLSLAVQLGALRPCDAGGLQILLPDLNLTPGSSGSFDVLLKNTDPVVGGSSFNIAGDSLSLSLSGPLSFQFTGVTIDTVAAPYLFGSEGEGGALSLDTFPNTSFTASDASFSTTGYQTIAPQQLFGLAHVFYSMSSTSPSGTDKITVSYPGTSLSDENGAPLPFTVFGGSITATAVPEPHSMTQAAIAAMMMLSTVLWRRCGLLVSRLGR